MRVIYLEPQLPAPSPALASASAPAPVFESQAATCVSVPSESFQLFRGQLLCCNFSGHGKNHTETGHNRKKNRKKRTTPSWLENNKGASERGVAFSKWTLAKNAAGTFAKHSKYK